MRHFYEMYVTAGENWLQSSVMVNIRNSSKGKKIGKYVWKKWQVLADEHGEDIANGIAENKKKTPREFELFKVFDSKEELREDEEEFDFNLGFEM
ncbi:unnamed protein product, partial [Symbiodinium sp. CCMP2456]